MITMGHQRGGIGVSTPKGDGQYSAQGRHWELVRFEAFSSYENIKFLSVLST